MERVARRKRHIAAHVLVAAMLVVGTPLSAGSAGAPEPVTWTPLADPDPNFVPPPEPRPERASRKIRKAAPPAASVEQAAYEAGLRAGTAAKAVDDAIARAIQASCSSIEAVRAAGGDVSSFDTSDCKR